jgi:hypothetical protein
MRPENVCLGAPPTHQRSTTVSRTPRLFAAAVLALALAACSGNSGDKGDKPAETKPVSWPQPVDGKLTPEMCDLLTADDFLSAGVLALEWKSKKLAPEIGPNAVTCHALGSHFLTLNLQPDPVSAQLYYQNTLGERRRSGKEPVQENGVPAADASWFGVAPLSATQPQHDISARRGGLLINLHLGFSHDDNGYDPRKAGATLVSLILERAPELGKVSTGKPHDVVLTVTGRSTDTASIVWSPPFSSEPTKEPAAKLPWTKTFQAPWYGTTNQQITFFASNTKVPPNPSAAVTCTATVDGKKAASQTSGAFAYCNHSFDDTP